MDFKKYQEEAKKTDQVPEPAEHSTIVPLLGLVGEAGTLVSEYKKFLRDGAAHERFRDKVAEELGDILWYLSTVASRFELDLEEIAARNIWKTTRRWPTRGKEGEDYRLLDEAFPEHEKLPRRLTVELREVETGDRTQVLLSHSGVQVADRITDNAYDDDGYRFHDVFHLAFAAVLGWSPTLRSFLGCKRKSDPTIDEVEDGGRAIVVEEAIVALIFDYARDHRFLKCVETVDSGLLRTLISMTSRLEVGRRSTGDWERAILDGFRIWRATRKNRGGTIKIDLVERRISYDCAEYPGSVGDADATRP